MGLGGQPFVLRALQPGEDRLDLAALARQRDDGLHRSLVTMGRLVACAQLRAAGRQGSATADELIDFGQLGRGAGKRRDRLVQASYMVARQLREDAAVFNHAFDDGAIPR